MLLLNAVDDVKRTDMAKLMNPGTAGSRAWLASTPITSTSSIVDGKIVEEWTLFNEFALLKRLYLARHAPSTVTAAKD